MTGGNGGLIILFMLPFMILGSIFGLFIGGQKSKSSNVGCLLILVVLIILAAGTGRNFLPSNGTHPAGAPKPTKNETASGRDISTPINEGNPRNTVEIPAESPVEPAKKTDLKSPTIEVAHQKLETLEGMTLPMTMITTNEVVLRDKTGKEVAVPTGSNIKVFTRSERGTLSMEINGAVFVGNESRILGKMKLTK